MDIFLHFLGIQNGPYTHAIDMCGKPKLSGLKTPWVQLLFLNVFLITRCPCQRAHSDNPGTRLNIH